MSSASPTIAPKTLRAWLTLWYVGALGLALVAFAALLYGSLTRTLYSHHDQELLADGDRIAHLLTSVPLNQSAIDAALRYREAAPAYLMVRDTRGDLMYRSPLLHVAEPSIGQHEALVHAAAHAPSDPEFFNVELERSGLLRFICTPVDRSPAAYVQIGKPLGDVPATLRAVRIASFLLVPLVVLLTSFGGWLIAGRALMPIDSINATLQAIEASELSRRVEVHPGDRELQGLVRTINGLLARLDQAFDDLRNFAANASHQLQTPLAVMKGTIELTRQRRSQSDLLEMLDELEQGVNDMSAIVSDLQTLSLADADTQRSKRTPVDLSELCAEAVEIISALGEMHDISVNADIAPHVIVRGDSLKLKQVVLNMGDNAVKYTSPGGRIDVRLRQEDGQALLEIVDTGLGINADELPHIFDRFYRGSSANGSTRGTGLGLTIAKRIVEVHGGTIAAESSPGSGTRFTVRLPAERNRHAALAYT